MKKALVLLLSVSVALLSAGTSFAAFSNDGIVAKTAAVTITGTASIVVPLEVKIKNVSNNNEVSQVSWSVALGSTDWKAANQYVSVKGFETYASWGIQIYTNNTAADANPKYTGQGNPAGLVNSSNTASVLPLCWRTTVNSSIRDGRFGAASNDLKITEKYIADDDTTVLLRVASDYISDEDYFAPWFWMLDKGYDLDPDTEGMQRQYGAYASFVASGQWKLTPTDFFAIPARQAEYCVYLGAKFTSAGAGTTYQTSKLTVQMYHL